MKIERIRIQGYRSLRDVSFEPEILSVLVGPNNAGKSNLLAAVDILEDIYGQGPRRAVANRGGLEANAFRGPNGTRVTTVRFETTVSFLSDEFLRQMNRNGDLESSTLERHDVPPRVRLRHDFAIVPDTSVDLDGISIDDEVIELEGVWVDRDENLATIRRQLHAPVDLNLHGATSMNDDLFEGLFGTHRSKFGLNELFDPAFKGAADYELFIPRYALLFPVLRTFLEEMQAVRLYHLSPIESRLPGLRQSSRLMMATGENLPSLIEYLQSRHPGLWSTVIDGLTQIAPDIDDVIVSTEYDGKRTLRFAEADSERTWLASEISDGTIRALAAMAAVVDPRSPLDLVEEPENSLHPWAIRAFIDTCRAAVAGRAKQIVLTTHSPTLLDCVVPEELFVVWRNEGETRIDRLINLDPDAQRLWTQGDAILSDLIDGGLVRESIPGGVG